MLRKVQRYIKKNKPKISVGFEGVKLYQACVYIFVPNDHFAAVRWQWETINIAYAKVIWVCSSG